MVAVVQAYLVLTLLCMVVVLVVALSGVSKALVVVKEILEELVQHQLAVVAAEVAVKDLQV
jgi:hypothetical protein